MQLWDSVSYHGTVHLSVKVCLCIILHHNNDNTICSAWFLDIMYIEVVCILYLSILIQGRFHMHMGCGFWQ